jgi:two-component system capsular synthesis response regulator RcsB
MFKKVLLVDGFDIVSISVRLALSELSILEINEAKSCDEAYLKIKKGVFDMAPYDLLISDLSFKTDYRDTKFNSGEELIMAVKKVQSNIKTIVFSEEVKSFRIKSLFNDFKINAFVYKGRFGVAELKKAVPVVFCENSIISTSNLPSVFDGKHMVEIEEYDVFILKSLSVGLASKEIALDFKKSGIKPNSISSIEKRINKLKIYFSAKNNKHLIAMSKDLQIL